MGEPIYEFRLQRGTAARWAQLNPTLGPGEPGVEIDTGLLKIGDGNTAWNDLEYYLTESYILGMIEVELAETGGLTSDPRVGDLGDLTTSAKTTIVDAINEVDATKVPFYVPFGRNGDLIIFTGPRLYLPQECELTDAVFSLSTPPDGSSAIFEVLKNGSPVYSIGPEILPSEYASSAGVLAAPTTFIPRTDYLQVQCTQTGSSVPGANLSVVLTMTPA